LADHTAQTGVVIDTNMLEHADRHEGIVLALDVAVVVLDEFDCRAHALALRPFPRERHLLVRDVEGAHLATVVPGKVDRETAPSAAGFDDTLAGPQTHL